MSATRQQEFDWSRGRQLAILRDCVLPEGLQGKDGSSVSQAKAKALLKLIDDYARGRTAFVSLETLVEKSQMGRRTVIRATQALHALSLLIVVKDGRRRCNRYTLVWSELALLCPSESHSCSSSVAKPSGPSQADDHVAAMAAIASGTVPSATSATSLDDDEDGQDEEGDGWHSADQAKCHPDQAKCHHGTLTVPRSAIEPPPPYPPDTQAAPEPITWGSAAAEIRAYGVQRTGDAIRYAKQRGSTPEELLDALRTCRANERLFARPPAALVEWCRSGDWPADGVRDWQTVGVLQRAQEDRRRSQALDNAVHYAFLEVRRRTPVGELIDDGQVVELAVSKGVPREYAQKARGVEG